MKTGVLLALLGGALLAARHHAATPVLALDVDGDGRGDRVRLARHDGGLWLDVELAARGFELASSTRVGDGDSAAGWSARVAARDDGGRPGVLVRDGSGRVTEWRADGLAFADEAPRR